ncbi:MAG: flavin-dependent dehydrogenase [Cellvibrionaceae bacterium]|jgi:flavin-dependent dehydrogenase
MDELKTPVKTDLLIIGSGPAGTSTALHLLHQDASWTDRMIIVDKAIHPREKLCGGGITHLGENVLADLGLAIEPSNFEIREVRLKYEELSYSFRGNPVFRIVHRAEFDHWLVKEVEKLGGVISQGEGVTGVRPNDAAGYIEVVTDQRVIHAKTVVAADGSRSIVRQKLGWNDGSHVARLIEVLTPETSESSWEFRDGVAVFDFSQMSSHQIQGYYWDFPSIVDGKTMMNRGVFDSRSRPELQKANLKKTLSDSMESRERSLDEKSIKGHPIRWLSMRGNLSRPHLLLAGDSAGADPLFGEGIAIALAYGKVASAEIVTAFETNDFKFGRYKWHILRNWVLFSVVARVSIARFAYRLQNRRFFRAGWSVARFIIGLTRWNRPDFVPARQPTQKK